MPSIEIYPQSSFGAGPHIPDSPLSLKCNEEEVKSNGMDFFFGKCLHVSVCAVSLREIFELERLTDRYFTDRCYHYAEKSTEPIFDMLKRNGFETGADFTREISIFKRR